MHGFIVIMNLNFFFHEGKLYKFYVTELALRFVLKKYWAAKKDISAKSFKVLVRSRQIYRRSLGYLDRSMSFKYF